MSPGEPSPPRLDPRPALAIRLWEAALVAALLGLAALAWIASAATASPDMRSGLLTGGGAMSMGSETTAGAAMSMGSVAAQSMSTRPAGGTGSLAMAALFLVTWLVMMVAMMFPAVTPVVLTFDRWVRRTGRSRWATAFFVGGYLLVWGASGFVVYAAILYLGPLLPSGESAIRLGAGMLVVAGAYQLTPFKEGCLRHCRSPLAFVAHHAARLRRGGPAGARVGAVHGLFCLGCCWALMLVLIALGMMSLVWMAAVAGVIFLEKALPGGWPVARLVGFLLVGTGTALLVAPHLVSAQESPAEFDVLLRGGTVYDGSGQAPAVADVAILGDTIAAVGDLSEARARTEIDVAGLAVAPGFINVLSWATESLIEDGRGLSDIRQGVTLEVFGEGFSFGPLTEPMKEELVRRQTDIEYEVEWTTLGEYLEYLVERGISPNVASFVGATTVRIHELEYEDRAPTPEELERMRELVRRAMEEGALGLGSSLIYAPAFYAGTDELVALASAAGEYGGIYISHLRSEGNRLLEAVDELLTIAREADVPAQIYHLKAAGRENWAKLERVIEKVDSARSAGARITADMYTYTAGATGLDAAMPPWVQEGGHDAWVERLRDPEVRRQVAREMTTPTDEWENLYLAAGSPENVLLVGFKQDSLKRYTGRTLAEVAAVRGSSPEETAMDLVVDDDSRVGTVYFIMSEENVRRKVALPWMAFDSDAEALAPEGVFLESQPHPRAYGSFARLLAEYVREEGIVPLEEAIRRLTSFPAENLGLRGRGRLAPGYFADIAVFDPETVQDHATFEDPHQLATGVLHVFVNGVQVLSDQEHTGATPGRVVRGPGWERSHLPHRR